MTVQINYKSPSSKIKATNLVLFVDEKFNIKGLKKHISTYEFSYISDLLKSNDLKKDLLFFEINSKKSLFLVSIKKDLKTSEAENLGAKFHKHISYDKKNSYLINLDTVDTKIENFAGHFLHGLKLKSYEFNKYKTNKKRNIIDINVIGIRNKRIEFLSMCLRNLKPKPLPSDAPSIIPGISAIINDLSSLKGTTPKFGLMVVNG